MRINYNQLKKTCLQDIPAFYNAGSVKQTEHGILIANTKPGNKVLAVAHLDSVLGLEHFYVNTIDGCNYVFNAQLDDRLGAYIILNLLPSLGLNYDILLTEGEETGNSTAQFFKSEKQYNWMFSFDRRGDDVVMYEYDNLKSRELLKQYKFNPSIGSFSDICFLDQLNCTGFNFGTGYYGEHSPLCYADMEITIRQAGKFVRFFNENKNTPMPYAQVKSVNPFGARFVDYGGWGGESEDGFSFDTCEFCGSQLEGIDNNYNCCEECAIDNGIFCESCSARINLDQMEISGLCQICENQWKDYIK